MFRLNHYYYLNVKKMRGGEIMEKEIALKKRKKNNDPKQQFGVFFKRGI